VVLFRIPEKRPSVEEDEIWQGLKNGEMSIDSAMEKLAELRYVTRIR
jgi:hypothetical protein